MAKQNELRGMVQATAPILPIGMPKLSASTSNSGSKKSDKPEDPKALWGHTYKYKMLEADAQASKVQVTNQLYSLAKNKYGGDLSAFINDPKVQSLINGVKQDQAMLSANRNSIETTYDNYTKARTNIEKKNAGSKYAIGDDGERLFVDQYGQVRSEAVEGYKINDDTEIEKQGAYLTNNQLLEHNRNNLGFQQTNDGRIVAEQGQFGNPADFTKNAVSDYALKMFNAAKTQNEQTGASPRVQGSYAGYTSITGINEKTNLFNLDRMTDAAMSNMPAEVQAQLKQSYWESGYDNRPIYSVKVPKVNNSGNVIKDKDGNTEYRDAFQAPTMKELQAAEKAINDGSATDIQKQYVEKNELSDAGKFGLFMEDEFSEISSGLINTESTTKMIEGGGGIGGSGGGGVSNMTHTTAVAALLKDGETADVNSATYYSLVKPAKKENGEIVEGAVYEKQEFNQLTIKYSAENAAPIEENNAKMKSNIIPEGSDEIDMDLVRAYGIPVSNRATNIVYNGKAITAAELGDAYIIEEVPVLHQFNSIVETANGPSIGKSTEKEGETVDAKQTAYKEYKVVVDRSGLSNLEALSIAEQQGGHERGDQVTAGADLDNGGMLGGFIPSDAAKAIGVTDIDTEGTLSLDQIVISIFVPVGAQDNLAGGGTTKQHKTNRETADVMNSELVNQANIRKRNFDQFKANHQ